MSIWGRIVNRVLPRKPQGSRIAWWPRTQSGQFVDEDTALKLGVVWACIDVRAKAVAILPWSVFQKKATSRKEATDNAVHWLLHNQPNPEMSPYQFKHLLITHKLLWGNAYVEIERDGMGRPVWLWPITPDRVTPTRNEGGALVYTVQNPGGADTTLESKDMLHFRGMGFDGTVGYSVVKYASQSIGLGLAMEEFGASFFGNGASPSVVLSHPKTLGPVAQKNLEDSVKKRSSGKSALNPLVLEEGMTLERLSIPPDEAQFIQSRDVNVLDICRWFGTPPHKVAALARATFNNVEQQNIQFVTDSVQSDVTQMEEEVNLKCFGRQQRGVFYTKMNMAVLLRGDLKSRYEAYQIGHNMGVLSGNDIRGLEEMNPIPNGNIYIVPANMTTRERMKSGQLTAPAPTADPEKQETQTDPENPEDPEDDSPDTEDRMRQSLKAHAARVNGSGHA